MRITMAFVGVAAATALLAAHLGAQRAPTKEFGVDVALTSTGVDGRDSRITSLGTPVDLRIGFLNASRVMFESRFSLDYIGDNSNSLLSASPSLNVLFRLGQGRGHTRQIGGYLTAGVLMDFQRTSTPITTESGTQFGVSAGAGTRIEWGTASAFRPEIFLTKRFGKGNELDTNYQPGSVAFGLRFGISFFQ